MESKQNFQVGVAGKSFLQEVPNRIYDIANQGEPRDLNRVWRTIENEVRFAPHLARLYFYSIPYKNKKTKKEEPVEGIGIRGAEALIRAWGHLASGGLIRESTKSKVTCTGIVADFKTNVVLARDIDVDRYQLNSSGGSYPLTGTHWHNAIQSGVSKAQRNALLQIIPLPIKDRLFGLVKELTIENAGGGKNVTIKQKVDNCVAFMKKRYQIPDKNFDDWVAGLAVDSDESFIIAMETLHVKFQDGQASPDQEFGMNPLQRKAIPAEPVEKNNANSKS